MANHNYSYGDSRKNYNQSGYHQGQVHLHFHAAPQQQQTPQAQQMRQPTEEEVRIAKSIRTFVLVTVGAMFALFLPPLILVYLGLWLYSRKAAKARLASANNATQSAFTGASVALPAANNALTSPSRRLSASRRKALAR